MAQVPTVTAPSVAPSGAPSGISAPAGAFGAGVLGAGLKETGAALQQGANVLASHALALQDMNNKASADEGYSAYALGANDLQSKFNALRGQDAMAALPEFQHSVGALREQLAGGMNPAAATYFNQETRRIEAGMFASARSHADAQQLDYIRAASGAKIVGAQQLWSANPTDENLLEFLGVAREEFSHQAHLALGETADAALVRDFTADKVSEIFSKTLMGLSGDDPIRAWGIAQEHDGLLRGDDRRVIGQLRRAAIPQMQALDADALSGPIASGAVVSGAPVSPVPAGSPVTGRFGEARAASGSTPAHTHAGTDYGVPLNTPIISMRPGTVVSVGPQGGYGLAVVVDEGGGRTRLYGHLRASGLRAGDQVQAGQPVGASGQSGNATGPSVHVELRQNNRPIDMGSEGANLPGVPPNSAQFRAGLDDALGRVDALARQRFPDDADAGSRAVYEQGLRSAIASRFSQHYDALRDNEANTTAGVLDYIDAHNVTDETQLPPPLRSALAALPPQTAHVASSAMSANSHTTTPAQQADVDEVLGMYAVASSGGDPEPFLAADIPSMNLPPRVASAYMAKQVGLRTRREAQSSRSINTVINSTPFKDALAGYGIVPNSSPYWQFVGRVHEAVDEFTRVNGNKPPTPKEVPAIVAGVVAQGAEHRFLRADVPASVIPQAEFDAINRELRAAGMTPSLADIGYIYQRRHGNGG